jgi:hypothetical protein
MDLMFLHGMTLCSGYATCLQIRNLRIPLILISQVAINFFQEKKRKHNKIKRQRRYLSKFVLNCKLVGC